MTDFRVSRRAWLQTIGAAAAWPAASLFAQQGPGPVEMIAETGEGARYWPRWRGPSGQGMVAGSGYVDRWSGTENVRWK
jgi:hypothetical protein